MTDLMKRVRDGGQTFQGGVQKWLQECFSNTTCCDVQERGDRFLEEALELLQSTGYDPARVSTLVDYVYGRPIGDPGQEVGGTMVTLAALCWRIGVDMHAEAARELGRITRPEVMDKIRRKQAAKSAIHFDSPLPGNAAIAASEGVDRGE